MRKMKIAYNILIGEHEEMTLLGRLGVDGNVGKVSCIV